MLVTHNVHARRFQQTWFRGRMRHSQWLLIVGVLCVKFVLSSVVYAECYCYIASNESTLGALFCDEHKCISTTRTSDSRHLSLCPDRQSPKNEINILHIARREPTPTPKGILLWHDSLRKVVVWLFVTDVPCVDCYSKECRIHPPSFELVKWRGSIICSCNWFSACHGVKLFLRQHYQRNLGFQHVMQWSSLMAFRRTVLISCMTWQFFLSIPKAYISDKMRNY